MSYKFQPRPLAELLCFEPYGPGVACDLRAIDPGLPATIGQVDELCDADAERFLQLALELACQAQNVANIELGRAALCEAPREWLNGRLERVARETLELQDEWEVRRFLELLSLVDLKLLRSFATGFVADGQAELKDVGGDFLEKMGAHQ